MNTEKQTHKYCLVLSAVLEGCCVPLVATDGITAVK